MIDSAVLAPHQQAGFYWIPWRNKYLYFRCPVKIGGERMALCQKITRVEQNEEGWMPWGGFDNLDIPADPVSAEQSDVLLIPESEWNSVANTRQFLSIALATHDWDPMPDLVELGHKQVASMVDRSPLSAFATW